MISQFPMLCKREKNLFIPQDKPSAYYNITVAQLNKRKPFCEKFIFTILQKKREKKKEFQNAVKHAMKSYMYGI
mgnify:CR=1 FL=1